MISNYSCIRKSYKWYTKIFFHFLEEAVYNAFVIYDKIEEGKKHKFMQFKFEVARQLLFLQPKRKRCIMCYKNNLRRETRYHCDQCISNPGLCAAPCFMRYHTHINYEYTL